MQPKTTDTILKVSNLVVHYETENAVVEAINNISFEMKRGETLGFVGETGAGKTTLALSILGLVPDPPGRVVQGTIELDGENIFKKTRMQMRAIRGKKVSMIFQDPMTSLNPVVPVGNQIAEVILLHEKCSRAMAEVKAVTMLEMVGIPGDRFKEYPHQFSGGMKQRVVIAIALACNPELLIADEPTTALDVTIQAQVLDMMRKLKVELNTSMIMITHDLGVIAETCDKVAVMYAGEIVEFGTASHIFRNAKHPYTIGLFGSLPSLDKDVERLKPIPGLMPDPTNLPNYCSFCDRCTYRFEGCQSTEPETIEVESGHFVKCRLFAQKGEA